MEALPTAVINLQGRVFMTNNDDPFRLADDLLKQITAKVILVDFPRRSYFGEGRAGLVPGRARDGGPGHAHPRSHRR